MRRLLFAVAMLVSIFAVLAWAAALDWRAPLRAASGHALDSQQFMPVMGAGSKEATGLRISTLGEGDTALQAVVLNGLDAAEYSLLRYRFDGFPHTLELSLMFRRADSTDDVRVVSLPWPGHGDAWFDLSSVPEWSGRIVELGFAQYPTPQVVPASQPFAPFTLVDAALQPRSWRGDFGALFTDWLGYWPWSQRSVHALGRDTDTPRAQSLVLCIALVIGLLVAWSYLLLRWRGRRLLGLAVAGLAAGWLLLDLQWQSGLQWRNEGTRTLYANMDWARREQFSADTETIAAAREVKAALAGEPDATRILVHAGSSFEQLRLVYHLLPLNVAVLAQVIMGTSAALPAGSVIVVYNIDEWRFDAARRVLSGGGLEIPADAILQRGALTVVRVREVGP
jgi:hypothetical protein